MPTTARVTTAQVTTARVTTAPGTSAPGASAPAPSLCCPVVGAPLSDAEAEATARVFKALADPTRVKLISIVSSSPTGEMCVCNLVEPLGLSQPTVSHHLKVLADAGLLRRERRASWVWYRVDRDALAQAAGALVEP